MSKNKRRYRMIIFWIIVSLIGTVITIFGGLKLNDEWSKKSKIMETHLIPDVLFLDFDVEVKLDSSLTEKILNEVLPKISDTSLNNQYIPLQPFFDEDLFAKNSIANNNYKLTQDIYNKLRGFELIVRCISKDKLTEINLSKRNSSILFSGKEGQLERLEVHYLNSKTKTVNISLHNIEMTVKIMSQNKYLNNFINGYINLHFIPSKGIEVVRINNLYVKSNTTKYFFSPKVVNGENTKLNQILF